MVQVGKAAPAFTLEDQNGKTHSLKDYKGKKVLLYFYPKDDTPGCTTQACNFRDGYADFKKSGLVILGVSKDSVASHQKFANKYDLPFPLLADVDTKVAQAYGVWQQKKLYGREYMGMVRSSFLIDENGKIAKIYDKVKPAVHADEVASDL